MSSDLKERPSTTFDDLVFLVRPGHHFEEPTRVLQQIYRAAAYTGWRLKRSRDRVSTEQGRQEERLKKPLRVLFGKGPIAGVVRKGPRGSRISVTQAKNRVPADPLEFLEWLGPDAAKVISKVELDPLILAHPKVAEVLFKSVLQRLGSVDLPIKLVVNHDALAEVVEAREDDVNPAQFFTEVARGEPTVYANYAP